ncbi:SH2 domain-containing protein 1B [Tachyglossus aculeatus]|uniref:SH2 domain-containing protein 1B n=1 Tax=Tachyglossus aculeatus TaxID=9261 RepID=UPI0018F7C836|nr:SH2 domain-containing protein 1B [Tachyglossus aculeatus]
MDLPFYHGPITKRDSEKLLLKDGKDGNFLLRDSETVAGAYCLCVSFGNLVYTYRIFSQKHGYFSIETTEGIRTELFPNLPELIAKYKQANQGMVTRLRHPVLVAVPVPTPAPAPANNPYLFWRRSKVDLEATFENNADDYVDVLP